MTQRPNDPATIRVIDSHTAGEPTRVVMDGGPNLGRGSMSERLERFRREHDAFRSAVVEEPRGSDVLVGALFQRPSDPSATAGVLFFNNAGCLGMCGHGAIGVVTTLAHMGRIAPGQHRIETPVGDVTAVLHDDGRVSVRNVPSYRHVTAICVQIDGYGTVVGDVAWGGNWFFLTDVTNRPGMSLELSNVPALTGFAWAVRRALARDGVVGQGDAEIDHVELFGPPHDPAAHSRNFVLCPGGAYDRSPCGTGTSAKLACLHANGQLNPGDVWRQEGILGTEFEGSVEIVDGRVVPSITGRAYVTAEATLILDPADPFQYGIRVEGA